MTSTRKPRRCQACGHQTTLLTEKRSADFDRLARQSGLDPDDLVPSTWLCDGDPRDDDGAAACLRRLMAKTSR
jgi:hypothetical protein